MTQEHTFINSSKKYMSSCEETCSQRYKVDRQKMEREADECMGRLTDRRAHPRVDRQECTPDSRWARQADRETGKQAYRALEEQIQRQCQTYSVETILTLPIPVHVYLYVVLQARGPY